MRYVFVFLSHRGYQIKNNRFVKIILLDISATVQLFFPIICIRVFYGTRMGRVRAWCFFFVQAFRRKIFLPSRKGRGGPTVIGCRKSLGVCSLLSFF